MELQTEFPYFRSVWLISHFPKVWCPTQGPAYLTHLADPTFFAMLMRPGKAEKSVSMAASTGDISCVCAQVHMLQLAFDRITYSCIGCKHVSVLQSVNKFSFG